ncbi:pyruvate kinase [Microbulbifer spongiae]|uniref:pyruvate kinase n=1 Tax=Microbulbifer spongiae TaxID=2944933 RepID=UPI00345ED8C4
MNRRTKIVATFGPASDRAETLCQLIAAGVDWVLFNFSHGDPVDHRRRVESVRAEAPRCPAGRFARGQKFGSVNLPMGV